MIEPLMRLLDRVIKTTPAKGYTWDMEGDTFLLIRPDGSVAMRATWAPETKVTREEWTSWWAERLPRRQ